MWCDQDRICYRRGKSRFYFELCVLYEAYQRFYGQRVTTADLKNVNPRMFDSKQNGHNCHCTFFFMVLCQIDIVDAIWGTGREGDPFGVTIPARRERVKA